MARLTEQELERILESAARAHDYLEKEGGDPEALRDLVAEVRRLRGLIVVAHPYLDANQAPAALQDELAAEVAAFHDDRRGQAVAERERPTHAFILSLVDIEPGAAPRPLITHHQHGREFVALAHAACGFEGEVPVPETPRLIHCPKCGEAVAERVTVTMGRLSQP